MKHSISNGSSVYEHQTPTLKAVGSNPAGRTNKSPVTTTVAGFAYGMIWSDIVRYCPLMVGKTVGKARPEGRAV